MTTSMSDECLKIISGDFSDMLEHPSSKISSGAYLRKYGKQNIALHKFIEYIENYGEITLADSGTNSEARRGTPRIPNNRLKVKVLMRDGNHTIYVYNQMLYLCGKRQENQ